MSAGRESSWSNYRGQCQPGRPTQNFKEQVYPSRPHSVILAIGGLKLLNSLDPDHGAICNHPESTLV